MLYSLLMHGTAVEEVGSLGEAALCVLSDDDALIARLLKRATSLSCSLGPTPNESHPPPPHLLADAFSGGFSEPPPGIFEFSHVIIIYFMKTFEFYLIGCYI